MSEFGGLELAGVLLFAVLAVIVFAWIVMPLVIFSRLRKVTDSLKIIEKNTADVAKFFNEKDVRIE